MNQLKANTLILNMPDIAFVLELLNIKFYYLATMKYRSQFIKENILIILIVVLGSSLRLYNLGNESFWFDETISSIAAIALSENGSPVFSSGLYYGRAILNTFLIALSFGVFGVSEFAGRFPSVIFGILTVILAYHIGSVWGNKRIGVIAAFLVAFSVWEIAWSRQARMYQQLQFFYLLSLYLFYEYISHREKKHLYLLIASFAATILSHVFGYTLIVVFLVFLAVSAMKQKRSIDIHEKRVALYIILIFLFLLGMAYQKGVISQILHTQVNYYDEYIYFLKKSLGFSLFLAIPGVTVLMNRDWSKGLLLTLSVVIPFYLIFFHVLLFGIRYLYFVIPIVFIFAAFFLDFMIEYIFHTACRKSDFSGAGAGEGKKTFSSLKASVKPLVYSVTLIALIVFMHLSPAFTFMPKNDYDLGPNAPRSDFRTAYSYVNSHMQPEDVIVSTWTAPAQFYLGKNDYWLTFNVDGTGFESFTIKNGSRDKYANSIVLKNTGMLENVTQNHTRGWIVTDNLAWHKLSPQSKDFIETGTQQELEYSNIRVYMWDNTNTS
ncbi:glycosyltransferase family 39 protein [Methanolobus halotolerans]|uniref:glycosyltransferase family 39 protein n=1 Tax=Methanolobus halotolerans TaxID=2052935 RepID=UPI00107FC95A|nr:glycosyltransferase family 39 protein [Methanolobus halotolerans]